MSEKVIRNASLEDIEAMKKKESVEGIPESKTQNEKTNVTKNENIFQNVELKPKKSIFEPQIFPVALPSRDIIIKNNLTSKNEIFVRRMGAIEEGLFMKIVGEEEYKIINATIDSVIDNCIRSNISVYSLSMIDKFALFFKILSLTYGKLKFDFTCAGCNSFYQGIETDLEADIKVNYLPKDYEYPKPIKIESYDNCDLTWYLTYPTIGDMQLFLDNENINNMIMLTQSIIGTVTYPDGKVEQVTKDMYEEIIINLNDADREKYRKFMIEFGKYGAQFKVTKNFCTQKGCIHCEHEQEVDLPFDAIFKKILSI